jgi:hypothetical protein
MAKNDGNNERFRDLLEAVSPTAPTLSAGFRDVHHELAALQNLGRRFVSLAVRSLKDDDEITGVRWSKFFTEPSTHRLIGSRDDVETFLLSKAINPTKRRGEGD